MKTKVLLYALLIILPFYAISQEKENPIKREQWEIRQTKDAKTGKIPRDELEKSRNIMSRMLSLMGAIPSVTWTERGPNTVGGRTRALMWDPNDNTNRKVWAGGVSGGLWYNTNITVNTAWQKVNDFWDNIAIGCIAYDPNDPQIFYVGTGERDTSVETVNTGGSGTGGGGIWKSTNGGTTWARLASTIPDYVTDTEEAGWREVLNIVVNSSGDIFALNYGGVYKSIDGGETWNALSGTNAPPTSITGRITDIEIGTDDILYIAEGGGFTPKIYKSTNASTTAFTIITPPGTYDNGRVDLVLAPSTSGSTQILYAAAASSDPNGGVRFFKKSVNAGATWTDVTVPIDVDEPPAPFTAGQGDYNLILGIKSDDPDMIYAGGTTAAISLDGGTTWKNEFGIRYFDTQNKFFVDNHSFAGRPNFPNEAVFGNDGGVFYSANWGDPNVVEPTFQRRTNAYNVTQFYSVAMAGTANSGLMMGGAQDNGTQTITSNYGTIGAGFEINGGDGGLCFIDQEDQNILIASYINCNFTLFPNGPLVKTGGIIIEDKAENGTFINAADYDSPNNKLYLNYTLKDGTSPKIGKYIISGTAPNYTIAKQFITIAGHSTMNISFIKVGKTAGTLFLGTAEGDVYKLTGITSGNQTLTPTLVMNKATTATGNVSCIDFGTTDNTIIVTKSNYNIKSVFYSVNSGTSWISKDDAGQGLPNIPIRYALINPKNTKQVLLATELGVWSTTDITALNPQWAPTNTTLAHVRCDMLKYRTSDETVAVATHGRGIFTTKINITTNCVTTLVLINPTDNKSTGTTTYQAGNTITASNIISGNANVIMKAGNSIELKPSISGGGNTFQAANGTVFQAYIQGCAN
jgi:photosystem II stability/assembly factor-like uncharacterized protein